MTIRNNFEPNQASELDPTVLSSCDAEPIHRPDAIQPHGMLLVADESFIVRAGAGAIEERLAESWLGHPVSQLLGLDGVLTADTAETIFGSTTILTEKGESLTARHQVSGSWHLIELEPWQPDTLPARTILSRIDRWAERFERTVEIPTLCGLAAESFRQLTGYDRVMIYRFLEDNSGQVIAEAKSDDLPSLMNHHFPATDVPKQARALYLRNRVRVIPDISYVPSPLRPADAGLSGLDMSDVSLRSVSPVHLQYMRNMGVSASASVSLIIDGRLWGLVACHHNTPRRIGEDVRNACSVLAGVTSRQIHNKEELQTYQERLRIRHGIEVLDSRVEAVSHQNGMLEGLAPDLRLIFPSDGFAVVSRTSITTTGVCPKDEAIRTLAKWVNGRNNTGVVSTHTLAADCAAWAGQNETTAGVLAISLPFPEPVLLLWLRSEIVEVVEWAGHPHKMASLTPGGPLQPRHSFETWRETVRGRARRWDNEQILGARRLRRHLIGYNQNQQLRELNSMLTATLHEREELLQQKDFLIREVNHRVQNSLQLVASFLKLQSRSVNEETATSLGEAQRRIAAIGLVHRRLYRDDYFGTVDLGRYIEELAEELCTSIGPEWRRQLSMTLVPVLISADRAINIGLVVTELVINISKYAYAGGSGPISIGLSESAGHLRVTIADYGNATAPPQRSGFGTRMMQAIVRSLDGTLSYESLDPGLTATLNLPVEASQDSGD